MVCVQLLEMVAFAVVLASCGSAPRPTAAAGDAVPLVRKPVVEYRGACFEGTVTKLSDTGFDVDGTAGLHRAPFNVKGTWTFKFCPALHTGKYRPQFGFAGSYRIEDVRIGDIISFNFDRINGANVCNYIQIEKRPGGLVPPTPVVHEEGAIKYHEWRNAFWDWHDRGIRMPDKFKPRPVPAFPALPGETVSAPPPIPATAP